MTCYKYNSTLAGFFVNFNKNIDIFSMVIMYFISHVVRGKTYNNIAKCLFL